MLALLHHLQPGTSVPLERLAQLVGATTAEIADDITTLSLCGVAPYYPDDLVAVFLDDGLVNVWAPLPAFERAVRLSSSEARALAAALQAAGFGPTHPLTARLLQAAAPDFSAEELAQVIRSAVTESGGEVYQAIALGIERSHTVKIVHRRAGADSETEREIEPLELMNDRGVWYVSAFCRLAGAPRTFRLDRIRSAIPTSSEFSRHPDGLAGRAFSPEGLPVALLRFHQAEDFSERDWPGARVVSHHGHATDVEVPFAGTAWIARMVCARLGAVEVREPADVRAAVAALASDPDRLLG
jgi:proteasome accessory factor C